MGALTRATRQELSVVGTAEFWGDTFAEIAGGKSLKVVCEEHGWAYGEVWRTIHEDVGLKERYLVACRGRAAYATDECIPIADASGDAALMTRERRLSAKVWDRETFGDSSEVRHSGLVPTLVIEVAGGVVPPRIERDVTPVAEVEPEQVSEDEI